MEGEAAAPPESSDSGGVPGDTGMDRNGNQTVEIIGGIKISAGTAAISVSGGNTQEIKDRNDAIFKMKDEFKDAKINPNDKAIFSDHQTLTTELPTLKNLLDKTQTEFSINDNLGKKVEGEQVGNTNKVEINSKLLTTKFNYAFTLGHEMLHVFDSINNYSKIMGILGRTTLGSHGYGYYKEYRAYNWMKDMGKDINVSKALSAYPYSPSVIDKVNTNLQRLNASVINP